MTEKMNQEKEKFRRGIILDVDGTLWDAVRVITDSWNAYGRDIPDVTREITYPAMQGCLGKTMPAIADILFSYLSPERRLEVLDGAMSYEIEYMWDHPGVLYPDVVTTLQKLKEDGWHLYIVSNCQKGYIEDFLHAAGAQDLIEDHLCYEDTHEEKGYNIKLCVNRNKLDYAVYVGDTAGDLQASRAAGIDFIYAAYGFGDVTGMEGVTAQISSFAQLPETAALLTGKD